MSTPEETFREEAAELLTDLEAALLELEDQPDDAASVDKTFRAMHTIKGAGAMFGFDKLSAFTHHLENAFDQVRSDELIEIRGELVPYLRLREWFGQQDKRPPIEQIVVTRIGDSRFGFTVDQVIGQHQTVIKPLGNLYQGVEGMSGATILGD